ncbi:MAG: hypothetical protein E6772_07815 [Dysgonomonas sp.]|nr:hypothetical protein [Dysgonomonas sp.]
METLQFTHIILQGAIIILSLYLGWFFTETKHRIADKHWLLNRKPFSCRPCLTFHFGWILSGVVALVISNLAFFILGATLSLITWLILEIENDSMIDD